jgi:hypothetical protein
MSSSSTIATPVGPPRARWFSLLEFVLGIFIVFGHNIFHILPNEVPILFVLGWISLRLRNGGWKYAGLSRPQSWSKIVALAILAAAILLLASELVVEPIAHRIWPEPERVSNVIESGASGWRQALAGLPIVWTFAAFGKSCPTAVIYSRAQPTCSGGRTLTTGWR